MRATEFLYKYSRATKIGSIASASTTVWDVDVSRDGKMVVSGSMDNTIRIWDGESGEMMHVFEGHTSLVRSVEFSPDSRRVVSSGSEDKTVRVWSVETGELASEPIECHGGVECVHYSPSGDRIASGAKSVQIWNAETGSGILSIRNSSVTSVVWTADGTHVIGVGRDNITIWNSHNGERLRTWKAHDNTTFINTLSLSPTGTHLASSHWGKKRVFVFDISTGEHVAALKHSQISKGIAYSPSGKFVATGCNDKQVYVWEAPAFDDPQINARKSRPPSFSLFLDRPAIPLAGPSRNNGTGVNGFGHSLPNHDQQASPLPRRIFNKVKSTFTNLFTHRSAGAAQTSPVRETIEPVEVAAERDKVFWVVIERTVWTPLNTLIFMVFYCRKPGPAERRGFAPINRDTEANSSQAATGNVATSGNVAAGPDSSPTQAGNSVIRTQPERAAAMSLSGAETQGKGQDSSLTPPEAIEMVALSRSSITSTIPLNPMAPARASLRPQPTPSTDPLSPVVAPCEASSSTTAVTPAQSSLSSNNIPPASAQALSYSAVVPVPVAVPISLEELAMLQEFRRRKATAEPLSDAGHDRESFIYPYASTSLSESRGSVTPNTSAIQPPSNPQRGSHPYPQPSQSLVGLDPLLNVVPSLRSPSLSPSRHFLTPTLTSNVRSMHTIVSAHDPPAEASLESAAQPGMRRPANDEDID